MVSRVINMNLIVSSIHVGQDVTEEEFCNAFLDFLEEHEWMCGGGITEEEDEE